MKKKTTTKKVVKRVTKAKPKEEAYSWVVEPETEAMKLLLERKEIELQKELEEVCSWKSVSGEKVLRLYALNKKIFNDNFRYCHKCPGVIRNVFKKVKMYHDKNKDLLKGE